MASQNQPATEAQVDTMPHKKTSMGLPAKPPPVKAHVPPAKKNWEKKNQNQDQNQSQSKAVPEVRPYFPPSKASGGVPNPTAQYMRQAELAPTALPKPRRILVVIDLNGTLLYRPSRKNPSRFVERPHTRQFLDYCLNTFCVAIWSSAKPDNVHKMVNQLFAPEEYAKLVAIWGRDTLGLSPEDYNNRVQCYKRLSVIWVDLARRLGQRWDQSNTVLVDDSSEKARSEPFNLIQLPEFEGDLAEQGFVLPQVHDFLNVCAKQRDVSSYIRAKRFAFKPNFVLGAPI